ncbi:unnamed protein product [Brassica rapa subsp. narinosa]
MLTTHISMLALPVDCPCTDFGQLMHHDAFGRDLCTCGLHFIGQSEILGSKSNVAMNAWLPQASYPCGNFSDTSSFKFRRSKASIGHAFTVRIRTENQNQTSFYPFVPHEISVLVELILGHLRYLLTDVPPQPNSPPDNVLRPDRPAEASLGSKRRGCYPASDSRIGLESSSTGSSFPADSAKPVPLPVVSLDSRQGHRIPLVRTSSELAVRRPGKAPERAVPSLSPGRHEAVRSRHISSSSSPPTVDGFGTGTPEPSLKDPKIGLPSTGFSIPSGHGISHNVFLTLLVFDDIRKCLNEFNPAGMPLVQLLLTLKVFQGLMIRLLVKVAVIMGWHKSFPHQQGKLIPCLNRPLTYKRFVLKESVLTSSKAGFLLSQQASSSTTNPQTSSRPSVDRSGTLLGLGWGDEPRLECSDLPDARQYRCGPPPEFPLASPRSGIVHHLSGPDRHAHTRTLLRRSRSVGCAPVRDPANQLPCALRVYSPVDSHTCQTPWFVFQDGSNGEPTGRRPEHADAKARREARAADHD